MLHLYRALRYIRDLVAFAVCSRYIRRSRVDRGCYRNLRFSSSFGRAKRKKYPILTNAFTESSEEFGWENARISTYLLEKREFICYVTPVAAFSGHY